MWKGEQGSGSPGRCCSMKVFGRRIFALVIIAGDSFPEQIRVDLSCNVGILGGVEIITAHCAFVVGKLSTEMQQVRSGGSICG